MRRIGLVAALAAWTWTNVAGAQVAPPAPEGLAVGDWTLAPIVDLRMRGEYRLDLDGQTRGALTERARLGVDAIRGPIEARVVLQDARLWDVGTGGDFITGPTPTAATGVYEAWGEAHTSGARPSFVRIGRQEIVWGEGRLLGVSDWSPTGRTLDAIRARLVAGDWRFEVFAALLEEQASLQAGSAYVPLEATEPYGQLFGARGEWSLDPLFAVEAYGLARVAQSNPNESFGGTVQGQTYVGALRLHGDARGWTWGAEGAYEGGHVDSIAGIGAALAAPKDRAAWAAAGHVGYVFKGALLTPGVRLGGSYASGDDGSGGTYKAFDPILPDAHTWYGAMDLLTWSNEIEANARVSIVPWTDGYAAVEYRYLRLAQAGGAWTSGYLETIGVSPAGSSADLGHEIDARLAWSPWSPVDLGAGYSALVLGDGARAVLGQSAPNLSHYAYLQAGLRIP